MVVVIHQEAQVEEDLNLKENNMFNLILSFVFGVVVTVAAPLAKKLITKIVIKGFKKASKEIDRWH